MVAALFAANLTLTVRGGDLEFKSKPSKPAALRVVGPSQSVPERTPPVTLFVTPPAKSDVAIIPVAPTRPPVVLQTQALEDSAPTATPAMHRVDQSTKAALATGRQPTVGANDSLKEPLFFKSGLQSERGSKPEATATTIRPAALQQSNDVEADFNDDEFFDDSPETETLPPAAPAIEELPEYQPEEAIEEVSTPEPIDAPNPFGLKPLAQLSTNILVPQPQDGLPDDLAAARFDREDLILNAQCAGRDWALTDYRWEASRLCHGPILFEQLNAERYGITYGCCQPIMSSLHFFATIPALPYKVWANGHDHCQYALGYYRPGSWASPQRYRARLSADAALFEAGIIVGLIYILP